MEILEPQQRLFSGTAKKRFGKPIFYGERQFGFCYFGVEPICYVPNEFGNLAFGVFHYGDFVLLSGIYRRREYFGNSNIIHRRYIGSHLTERLPYFIPKNPRSIPQQANRGKFALAVAFWQGLTSEQKIVYNQKTKGRNYTGYNLCLREYLLSH